MRGNPVDIAVGKRLEAARVLMDLERRTLAARVGVSVAELLEYERGERRIGAGQLVEFARALQVGLSFFFSAEHADARRGGASIPQLRRPDHDPD